MIFHLRLICTGQMGTLIQMVSNQSNGNFGTHNAALAAIPTVPTPNSNKTLAPKKEKELNDHNHCCSSTLSLLDKLFH